MSKIQHNYQALITYRGWNEQENVWIYGNLINDPINNLNPAIGYMKIHPRQWDEPYPYEEYRIEAVASSSIGIYTGIDDIKGNPIFSSIEIDGEMTKGGDIVRYATPEELEDDNVLCGNGIAEILYHDFHFKGMCNTNKIIGTQYEQDKKKLPYSQI